MPVLGGYALGVELHAVHGQRFMLKAHDRVARFGRHFETIRQASALDSEGVIARALKGIRHIGEDALAGVGYGRQLAMHEFTRPDDLTTEGLTDRLVTQANAKDRS